MPALRNGSWSSPPIPSERSTKYLVYPSSRAVRQPFRAHRVTTQLNIFRPHQVQQYQRPYAAQLIVFAEPGNKLTATISVVWSVRFTTLVPFFTEGFLAVEEHKPVS